MSFEYEKLVHYWANRFCFLVRKELHARFLEQGENIRAEEWAILLHLWQQDGLAPSVLADKTIRDRTTMTRFLDAMVKKGLVTREVSPDDRRRIVVRLTQQAHQLQKKLIPIALKLVAESTAGVADADVEIAQRVMRQMTENLLDLKIP